MAELGFNSWVGEKADELISFTLDASRAELANAKNVPVNLEETPEIKRLISEYRRLVLSAISELYAHSRGRDHGPDHIPDVDIFYDKGTETELEGRVFAIVDKAMKECSSSPVGKSVFLRVMSPEAIEAETGGLTEKALFFLMDKFRRRVMVEMIDPSEEFVQSLWAADPVPDEEKPVSYRNFFDYIKQRLFELGVFDDVPVVDRVAVYKKIHAVCGSSFVESGGSFNSKLFAKELLYWCVRCENERLANERYLDKQGSKGGAFGGVVEFKKDGDEEPS